MKKIVLFSLLVMCTSMSSAHNYYVGFSELKYNDFTQQFELSIELSLHDIEQELMTKKVIQRPLSTYSNDALKCAKIAAEITKSFLVTANEKACTLNYQGMEIQLNGLVTFYFSSDKLEIPLASLSVQFDTLMESLKDQQNKLTFIYRNQKQSYLFLQTIKKQEIKLSAL